MAEAGAELYTGSRRPGSPGYKTAATEELRKDYPRHFRGPNTFQTGEEWKAYRDGILAALKYCLEAGGAETPEKRLQATHRFFAETPPKRTSREIRI